MLPKQFSLMRRLPHLPPVHDIRTHLLCQASPPRGEWMLIRVEDIPFGLPTYGQLSKTLVLSPYSDMTPLRHRSIWASLEGDSGTAVRRLAVLFWAQERVGSRAGSGSGGRKASVCPVLVISVHFEESSRTKPQPRPPPHLQRYDGTRCDGDDARSSSEHNDQP